MSNSPYDPPSQPPVQSAPTTGVRPTSVTVLGVLSLAFGIMGFFGTILSLVMMLGVQDAQGMKNPILEAMNQSEAYRTFLWISTGLGIVVSLLLIVVGIGLLNMWKLGRTLGISYAWYTIIMTVVSTFMTFQFVLLPVMRAGGEGPERIAGIAGAIGGLVGSAVGLIFPIAMLYFLTRERIKLAFEQWHAAPKY